MLGARDSGSLLAPASGSQKFSLESTLCFLVGLLRQAVSVHSTVGRGEADQPSLLRPLMEAGYHQCDRAVSAGSHPLPP